MPIRIRCTGRQVSSSDGRPGARSRGSTTRSPARIASGWLSVTKVMPCFVASTPAGASRLMTMPFSRSGFVLYAKSLSRRGPILTHYDHPAMDMAGHPPDAGDMRLLWVSAHPESRSLTAALREEGLRTLCELGHE